MIDEQGNRRRWNSTAAWVILKPSLSWRAENRSGQCDGTCGQRHAGHSGTGMGRRTAMGVVMAARLPGQPA
jgi:hypothetical protein